MRVDDFPARFDRALAPLIQHARGPIGLAVSGGGDSLALLHWAACSSLLTPAQLHAFTVDHGLRAEAQAEAELVADVALTLGVAHTTLTWRTPNPSQSRARDARHRLLASALRAVGGTLLLTGHTLSDNIESFLIRARAGSGWYGLSGMGALTASPVWPEGNGIFVARPLLAFERAGIREWLETTGAKWCDDPSNDNPAYERVRMRRLLAGAPRLTARIARIQAKLSQLRRARDRQLADCLASVTCAQCKLELPLPAALGVDGLSQLLAICAMIVSGSDRPARTARSLSAAQRLLQNQPGGGALTLTLGGAVIRGKGDGLQLQRESNRPGTVEPTDIRSRLRHIGAGLTGALPAYV